MFKKALQILGTLFAIFSPILLTYYLNQKEAHRCSCMSSWKAGDAYTPVDRLPNDSIKQGEQAEDNDHTQTSFLRRLVPRMGYGSGNSLFRFRERPGHSFLSRQPASKPKMAGGKQPDV